MEEEERFNFLVQFDFNPGEDLTKLSVKAGDVVEFLYGDEGEDWWFGKFSGKEGWFPSAYGSLSVRSSGSQMKVETVAEEHQEQVAPIKEVIKTDDETNLRAMFRDLKPQERKDSVRNIFNEMKENELLFGEKIRLLLVQVVEPILVRDTSFKRDFMQEYSLAVIFSVMQDIEKASSDFLQSLRESCNATTNLSTPDQVAKCFKDFSPTLRLFSQYTLEISNAFNSLKKLGKPLNQFLKASCTFPDDLPMEQILVLPVDHYSTYLNLFQRYVYTSGDPQWENATISDSEYIKLDEALSTMQEYSREVDAAMETEKEKQLLLTIQNRFLNNPEIYTPTRRFVMEGDLERIDLKKKTTKIYFAHLFNDTLVISTNWRMGLKFHRAVNLSALDTDGNPATNVKEVASVVYSNMFEVATPSITYTFCCGDKSDMTIWMTAIMDQIQKQYDIQKNREKTMKLSIQASAEFVIPTNNQTTVLGSMCESLKNMDIMSLESHTVKIVQFLDAEFVDSAILNSFRSVVISPLAAASRGAALVVGALTEEQNEDISRRSMMQEKGTYMNAITKASVKSQTQAITAALVDDADALLCIRTADFIATSMQDFLTSFENAMKEANWSSDRIRLTEFFLSQGTKIFFTSFITYSSGMLAMIRLLCKSKIFTTFRKEAEENIRPHRIESILRNILLFPYKCQHFLTEMSNTMSKKLLDNDKVGEALAFVDDIIVQIENEIAHKKNYEKLLEIKSGFLTGIEFIPDPVLKGLVTTSRTFIAEDELQKVCRKKNKPFRFWLFNDYLVYGSSAVGGYRWHHALDLSQSSVKISEDNLSTDTYTFAFTSPDKSFMLIAPSTNTLHKWVDHIEKACQARRIELGIASSNEIVAAPVWVQDSVSSGCCVCQAEFKGFFNRKHHCRECGYVVCAEHSAKKKFLPNIHAKKKQRVCDNCFAGKNESCATKPSATPPASTSTEPLPTVKGGRGPPPIPVKSFAVGSSARGPPPLPSKAGKSKGPPPIPSFPPSPSTQQVPSPSRNPPPIPSFPPSSGSSNTFTDTKPFVAGKLQPPPLPSKKMTHSSPPPVPKALPKPVLPTPPSQLLKPPPTLSSATTAPPPPPPPPASRSAPTPPPPPPTNTTSQHSQPPPISSLPTAAVLPPPPPPPPPPPRQSSQPPPPPPAPEAPARPRPPSISREAVVVPERKAASSGLTMSLLQSIQSGGASLKSVTAEEKQPKRVESGGGGLLGMLASAMSERRTAIIESDEDDDDEDSGWSSDDSN